MPTRKLGLDVADAVGRNLDGNLGDNCLFMYLGTN